VGRLAIDLLDGTYSLLPCTSFRHQPCPFDAVRMTTTEQIEALHDNRIQLGLIRPPISDDELSVETVLNRSSLACQKHTRLRLKHNCH